MATSPTARKDGKAKGVKSLYFEMRSLSFFRTQLNETPSLIHSRLPSLLLFSKRREKETKWKKSLKIFVIKKISYRAVYINLLEDQKNGEETRITIFDDGHFFKCMNIVYFSALMIIFNTFRILAK